MNQAYLELDTGQRIELVTNATVGRSHECSITLDVAAISRHHADLEARSGSWWLQDRGSKNGTFVNGESIGATSTCLADGDVVVFAGAITAMFRDPAATPIAPRIGRLSGVWIDPTSDAVWVDAVRIEPPLSAKQLQLLRLLDDRAGEVVSRADIVDTVWHDAAAEGVSDDAVTALLKRLRARLREGPLRTDYLEIVKGRGVRLQHET